MLNPPQIPPLFRVSGIVRIVRSAVGQRVTEFLKIADLLHVVLPLTFELVPQSAETVFEFGDVFIQPVNLLTLLVALEL